MPVCGLRKGYFFRVAVDRQETSGAFLLCPANPSFPKAGDRGNPGSRRIIRLFAEGRAEIFSSTHHRLPGVQGYPLNGNRAFQMALFTITDTFSLPFFLRRILPYL